MNKSWDQYFLDLCNSVGNHSKCLSVKRGVVCVRDKTIISTGYNGPARGIPECGAARLGADDRMSAIAENENIETATTICPRYLMGARSGEMLDFCIAAHAEANCIANATREGMTLKSSTMYMNFEIPCYFCLNQIINTGIVAIVCTKLEYYDKSSEYILTHSNLLVREFGKEF